MKLTFTAVILAFLWTLTALCDPICESCQVAEQPALPKVVQAVTGSCDYLATWDKNTGRWENKCHIGAPINPANGEVYLIHPPDFTLKSEGSEISFFRTYRSFFSKAGALGNGWVFNFEEHLAFLKDVQSRPMIEFIDETGKSNQFVFQDQIFKASSIPGAKLSELPQKVGYQLELPEGGVHVFDLNGRLTKIRFSSGQALSLKYGTSGLSEVSDLWGRTIRFNYLQGRIEKIVASSGPLTQVLMRFEYDSSNRLTRTVAADGSSESYRYLGAEMLGLDHFLVEVRDGEGRVIEAHKYNAAGEGIFSSSKEGSYSLAFEDLKAGQRKVTVVNEKTHQKSEMIYDGSGNQLTRDQEIGIPSARSNKFDNQGRLTAQVNGGVETQIRYDGQNPAEFDQSAGGEIRKTHFEYDHPHHLVTRVEYPSVVDPKRSKSLSFKYSGDSLTEQVAEGYTLDLDGKVVSYADRTHYKYDKFGRVIQIQDPSGHEYGFEFYGDGAGLDSGRLKSLSAPGQPLVEFSQYDWFGNALRTVYGGKVAVLTQTNAFGKLLGDTSGNSYRYDRSGRIAQVISPSGETKTFKYDQQGVLEATSLSSSGIKAATKIPPPSAEKAEGEKTEIFPKDVQTTLDARGNVTQIIKNFGKRSLSVSLAYDREDHLVGVTWPNGSSSRSQFDDRGHIVAEQSENQLWKRRAFSPDGQLLAEKSSDGKLTEYQYDSQNRLAKKGDSSFQYLGDSKLLATARSKTSEIGYEYDSSGQLVAEVHKTFNPDREWRVDYRRDLAGNITKISYPDQYAVSVNPRKIASVDEVFFEVKAVREGRPSDYRQGTFEVTDLFDHLRLRQRRIAGVSDLVFQYDASDRPTLIQDRIRHESEGFSYSEQGFLVGQTQTDLRGGSRRFHIDYDGMGNLTSMNGPGGRNDIQYPVHSNLPLSHDEAGRVNEREGWTFNYNSSGLLVSAVSKGHRVEFAYDPLGRRISKTSDGKTTYFIYDEMNRLVFEETPSDQKKIRYIYRGHELIAFQVDRPNEKKRFSVLNDQRLSPQWIREARDERPRKLETAPYDPGTHEVADFNLGGPGQYYDAETGLYYNIARYYDPKSGRYLSPDPVGISGGANPYLYAEGNPAVFVDPNGTTPSDSDIITEEDANECNKQGNKSPLQVSTVSQLNPQQVNLPDEGEVWRVGTNRWNSNFEKMYSDWIRAKVDPDFMKRFQIKVDCADVTAVVRAIFSRIYHLPALFTNGSTSASNATKTWAHVPSIPVWNADNWESNLNNDKRFRDFIGAVSDIIHIPTLPLNTYPVKLTDESHPNSLSSYIQPGTVIMNTHHAEFVKDIDKSQFDPMTKMNSTSPAAVRSLWLEPMDIEYPGSAEESKGRGFANWNWVVNCGPQGWKHVDATRMPGYSLEQYQYNSYEHYSAEQLADIMAAGPKHMGLVGQQDVADGANEATAYKWKLAHPNENIPESFHNYIQLLAHDGTLPHVYKADVQKDVDSIIARITRRAGYVNDALQLVASNPNAFTGKTSNADDYSTPDFDSSDKTRFIRVLTMLESAKGNSDVSEDQFKAMLFNQWVDIGNGHKVNAYYYSMALLADDSGNYVSSDPGSSLESRWGYKWVQEHAQTLASQLATAQQAQNTAKKQLTDFQSAHPVTGSSLYLQAAAKAKSLASWLPVDTTEAGLQASYDSSKNNISSIQKELQTIQANYGIKP
jgi:RHS repeat-associated protein